MEVPLSQLSITTMVSIGAIVLALTFTAYNKDRKNI